MLVLLTSLALAQAPLQEAPDTWLTAPTLTCDATLAHIGVLPTEARPHGRLYARMASACPGVFADTDEVCITVERTDDDRCLGFFDEDGTWRCEDATLQTADDAVYCGETAHFLTAELDLDADALVAITVVEQSRMAPVGNGNGNGGQVKEIFRYTGVNLKW